MTSAPPRDVADPRSAFSAADVSVAIPTYERGAVLLDTLAALLAAGAPDAAPEILVIDQTPRHAPEIEAALARFERDGRVRRLRLPQPSIPVAMNTALRAARRPLVLFLDDDIVPAAGLLAAHAAAYTGDDTWAVAGQVLQPGEEPLPASAPVTCATRGLGAYLDFPFRSSVRAFVANGMAGNLSVRRERALAVGGFDRNFAGAAYRFETEFCRRLVRAGGRILFEPAACIRHLRAARGGTRARGSHLTSASPLHGVGDYYFALREARGRERWAYVLRRPLREVCTRFHLRRPWWIPVKLLGEARALALALRLHASGPRLLAPDAARRSFYERFQALGASEDGVPHSEAAGLRRFVEEHGLERGRVLEIGSGRGTLAGLARGWVGVDLAHAAGRLARGPFAAASATALPFRDGSFDGAWSVAVLEHVPEPERALEELRRVLRPGGVAYLAPAWHCRPWAAEGLHVRPYAELTWRQRLSKASIPVRDALPLRAALALPGRVARELAFWLRPSRPTRLSARPLQANYSVFWAADSDACNALDPHDMLLWFLSRGWGSPSHPGRRARFLVRHGAIVVRKP